MVQCTVRETRPAQWAEAGCGGTSLQSLHFEDTGYKIKSSRLAWGQSISVVSLGYMRSWLETKRKAKQKVARGERQKTVKVMGSKALWVGRGLAEVKCSRKYEYRTLYEEARKRREGLGQTECKEEESIGETCVWSAALALSSLRSPGPLPTSLSTESIHAELTPSPLKKRCKYSNCLLLTKIHV